MDPALAVHGITMDLASVAHGTIKGQALAVHGTTVAAQTLAVHGTTMDRTLVCPGAIIGVITMVLISARLVKAAAGAGNIKEVYPK